MMATDGLRRPFAGGVRVVAITSKWFIVLRGNGAADMWPSPMKLSRRLSAEAEFRASNSIRRCAMQSDPKVLEFVVPNGTYCVDAADLEAARSGVPTGEYHNPK